MWRQDFIMALRVAKHAKRFSSEQFKVGMKLSKLNKTLSSSRVARVSFLPQAILNTHVRQITTAKLISDEEKRVKPADSASV